MVAVPHVSPFDWHTPAHSVVVEGHTHVNPEHTPSTGDGHDVPAGCGTSAGHTLLAALHDWLVSHAPVAV